MRTTVPIAIFAIALYCYWPAAVPVSPCVVGYETLTTACSLAHKASFSDPFWIMPTGPTAHLAPLLPLVFSALFRLFGDGPDGLYAVHWVSSLTFALQVSLWPWVAESLGMGFASGVLGALAWLCVGYVLFPMWEAPQLAVLLPLLAVCAHRLLSRRVSTAFVFLVALLWAITFLFSPVPILVYLVLTGWIFALPRVPGIQKAAWLVVPFLLISPWLIRNYTVFHHVFLVRDNLGTELSISNNSCATYSFDYNESHRCYDHPNKSIAEAQKIRDEGEYDYNQEKLRGALDWIERNPGTFAGLTEQRFVAFWLSVPSWSDLTGARSSRGVLIVSLVAPLSIAGLWVLFRRDRCAAWICFAWLALFPPIYYFVQFTPRYRYPILWASFLPASFFATETAQRAWRSMRKSLARVAPPADSPPIGAASSPAQEKSSHEPFLMSR